MTAQHEADRAATRAERHHHADRHAYWRAGFVGGGLATIVFLLILLHGQASLLRTEPLSNFYDVQAHSLVNLRWNVPAAPLGIEGFRIGSRTYEYFGPWPAILRLPVAVVTHQFDGQLTQISMLLAFLVAMVATIRLAWCVREIARGAARVTFGELFAAGGFTFLVGAGSVLLFLSSRLLVFHEAEIWGVALALAAFEWVIRYAQTQRGLHLALACGLSTLAVLSRVSVGAGPLIALGIVFLAGFGARTRGVAGLAPDWATRRNALRVVAALLIPFALYVYVNYAKFGSAFSVPFDRQVVTFNDPLHRQVLAANNNSMIGPQFVPTVLAQYVRPDAIRFDSLFPWVAFPPPAHVFGHVSFDRLDVTSSIPGTMPALGVLAIIGLVVVVRRRRDGRVSFAALRPSVVGALLSLAPALAFGFITQRYLADVVPLLVLTALPGVYALLQWGAKPRRAVAARFAWAGLAILVVLSVWWNAGFAILYQREFGYMLTNAEIADFVDFQYSVHDRVPGGEPPHLLHGTALPSPPSPQRGTLFDLGNCAGLYWSSGGRQWRALEQTNATGLYMLRAVFPPLDPETRAPLVSLGSPGANVVLASRSLAGGAAVLELLTQGPTPVHLAGVPFAAPEGQAVTLRVVLDTRLGEISVMKDGKLILSSPPFQEKRILANAVPADRVLIGQGTAGAQTLPRFPGQIESLPVRPELCRRIVSS